jgi:hypothetical protein
MPISWSIHHPQIFKANNIPQNNKLGRYNAVRILIISYVFNNKLILGTSWENLGFSKYNFKFVKQYLPNLF